MNNNELCDLEGSCDLNQRSRLKSAGCANRDVPAVSPFELDCVRVSDLKERMM